MNDIFIIFVIFGLAIFVFWMFYVIDPKHKFFIKEEKPEYDLRYKDAMFADAKQVKKIINSCNTYSHLTKSRKLIRFLLRKYEGKVDIFTCDFIMRKLYSIHNIKFDSITKEILNKDKNECT